MNILTNFMDWVMDLMTALDKIWDKRLRDSRKERNVLQESSGD